MTAIADSLDLHALLFVLLALTLFNLGTATAQGSASKSEDRLALGESDVKQLLLLMDIDKNGKISKQEYMQARQRPKRGIESQGANPNTAPLVSS